MNWILIIAGFFILSKLSNGNGIGAIKKSTWFAPYSIDDNGNKKVTMPGDYTGKSGVYFIKQVSSSKIVYVGYSTTQLKKTIYRHFQVWNDKSYWGFDKPRITYSNWQNYKVRVIECTPLQAEKAEKYFIRKWQPKDNEMIYDNLPEAEEKALDKIAEKIELEADPLPF